MSLVLPASKTTFATRDDVPATEKITATDFNQLLTALLDLDGRSSGTIFFGDGLVGTPSVAFANETNSGLYRAAAGDIRLTVLGTAIGKFSSTGFNVLSGQLQEAGSRAWTAATFDPTLKAPLASPTFTGTPASVTAAADTNSTQIATTAFVVGQAGGSNPLMNGSVAVGTSLRYSRQDHVHPVDTSRWAVPASISDLNAVGAGSAITGFIGTFQATNTPATNYATGLDFGTAAGANYRTQLAAVANSGSSEPDLYARTNSQSATWGSWRKLWHAGNLIVGTTVPGPTGTGASGSWGINITGSAGSVSSSLTISNSGSGDASGAVFNGSAARTISYNSIGAAPAVSPAITGSNTTIDTILMPGSSGNTMVRPSVGAGRMIGEIGGIHTGSAGSDDGFLRISAGGGTTANTKAYIEFSGYSTVADMNTNLVFGTAAVERMRINNTGNLVFALGSGNDAIKFTNSGARLHLGAGTNDYLYSDGTQPAVPANFYVANTLLTVAVAATYVGNQSLILRGGINDGASAIGVKIVNNNALTTAGAKIASFYSDNGTTEEAFVDKDGGYTGIGPASTSGVTTQDSPALTLRGTYWNGSVSTTYDATIVHDITATTPASKISFRIAGSEKAYVDSNGYCFASYFNSSTGYFYSTTTALLRGGVADSGTAIATKLGSANALATAGAKIVSFYNDNWTTEKAYINKDGTIVSLSGASTIAFGNTTGLLRIQNNSNVITMLNTGDSPIFGVGNSSTNIYSILQGQVADGGTAIALKIGNVNALSTSGAKIVSFYNDNGVTEKAYLDKDGTLSVNQVLATNNGNGTNIKVGDDAWIGDINIANTLVIKGVSNSALGYVAFGNNTTSTLGWNGTDLVWGANKIWHAGNVGAAGVTLIGFTPINKAGDSGIGDLGATSNNNYIHNFSFIQAGYVESSPVNFRFDQDVIRFVNRWSGITLAYSGGLASGDADVWFSQYAGSVNLNTKSDACTITLTGISIGNSADTEWYPYVLMHSSVGGGVLNVKMELLKAANPGSWEIAYNGAVTTFYIAKYTSVSSNLIGARWTFYNAASPGSAFSANIYVRSIGVIGRNSQGYAWNIMKSGDTLYGNLSIAPSYAIDTDRTGTLQLGITNANAITLGKTGVPVTVPGDLFSSTRVGAARITLRDDGLENRTDALDTGAVSINYYGYNGATTYYRNLNVYNGKNGSLLTITGSTGVVNAVTQLQEAGSRVWTAATLVIANYAPLASPVFTGTPSASTAAVDTNTTQLATTAFVVGQASAVNPLMDGTVSIGTSLRYARADHVHPADTTKAADSLVVHLAGSESITGVKAFTVSPTGPDPTTSTQLSTKNYVDTAVSAVSGNYAAPVQDLPTLRGLAYASLPDKQLRLVEDQGALFRYDTTATGTDDGVGLITPTGNAGSGRWLKVQAATQSHGSLLGLQGGGGGEYYHLMSADVTKLAGIAAGAQVNDTAAQILTKIMTVDGAASGLDADLLDGQQGSYYAPLASPTFTGTPAGTTAAVDTNTTQLATTAFVLAQAAAATPLIDGTAAVGTSTRYARADHVHPTDTTRQAALANGITINASGWDANAAATVDINGALLRIGDMNGAQTQTNGVGIKLGDQGLAHASIKWAASTSTLSLGLSSNSNFLAFDVAGTTVDFNLSTKATVFNGTVSGPTASVDTNTTQLATTAFVLAQAASANPVMDGSVAVGVSTRFARADHVHPSDTSRAPTASPTFTVGAVFNSVPSSSALFTVNGSTASGYINLFDVQMGGQTPALGLLRYTRGGSQDRWFSFFTSNASGTSNEMLRADSDFGVKIYNNIDTLSATTLGVGLSTASAVSIGKAGNYVNILGNVVLSGTEDIANGRQWFSSSLNDSYANAVNSAIAQDHLQFRAPDTCEAYINGSWVTQTVPTAIFTGDLTGSWTVPNNTAPNTWDQVRFTWTAATMGYRTFDLLCVGANCNGHSFTVKCQISSDGSTWVDQFTSSSFSSWPGYLTYRQYITNSGFNWHRLIFTFTWSGSWPANSLYLNNVRHFGGFPLGGSIKPFTWDYARNATFPATVTATSLMVGANAVWHAGNLTPLALASSGTPADVGTAALGVSTTAAKSDHVHGFTDTSHGNRGGGTLHATVTGATNGFMIAADKTKLDNATASVTASTLMLRDANSRAILTGLAVSSILTDLTNASPWYGIGQSNTTDGSGTRVQVAGYYGLQLLTASHTLVIPTGAGAVTLDGYTLYHSNNLVAATQSVTGLLSAADKTKLDGIATGAQVNDTAAQILTKLLTVDGIGSGLDADTLDGQAGSYYAPINAPSFTGLVTAGASLSVTGNITATGSLTAATKSFLIDHPTKPGRKLRHGSLEGPENGVYVRGRLTQGHVIRLPEYWAGLVDPESITVEITPLWSAQRLYVGSVGLTEITIFNENSSAQVMCFYTVYAERRDVAKLQVEE